jgi:Putative Ig domain
MAIRKSSNSGIPFGSTSGRPSNNIGQPYFNGEIGRLELYTQGSGWQNIVQETPGVSSITGTYLESDNSGTIVISGTNFVSGCYATAIGSNGVQVDASSTVFNSLVQVTATFTGLSNQYEPYDIKVTNPSNLFGMLPDALYINATPVWQTASGSLGTFNEQISVSVSATATDSDSTITYSLASGSSLPSGLTLNSSTGLISGTLPEVSIDTTYNFTINASDGANSVVPRSFSILVSNVMPGLTSSYPAKSGTEIYDWMVSNGQTSFTNGNYWIKPSAYSGSAIECFVWLENNSFGRGAVLVGSLDTESGFSMANYASGKNMSAVKSSHVSPPGTCSLLPQSFINALAKDATTNHIVGGMSANGNGNNYGTFWQIRPVSAPAKGVTSSTDMWRYIFATGEANNNVQLRVNTDAQSNVGWNSYSFHNSRNIPWGSWSTFTGGRSSSDGTDSHHYMPDDQTGGGEWMFRENNDDTAFRAYGAYALSNFYIV